MGSRTFKTSPKSSLCPEVPKCEARRSNGLQVALETTASRDSKTGRCLPQTDAHRVYRDQVVFETKSSPSGLMRLTHRGSGVDIFPLGQRQNVQVLTKPVALFLILRCIFLSLTQ